MKTIGIVCEGPRDFDMLTQVIMRFMNEEYLFLPIQPDQDIISPHGAGWKGVLRWCAEYKDSLPEYFSGIDPQIDLLVIQIDGDVPRCEHEIYCNAVNIGCSGQTYEDPLNCSIAKRMAVIKFCLLMLYAMDRFKSEYALWKALLTML